MNIETLLTILVVAALAALLSRIFGGFTLAGFLTSYLLACLAAVGGWYAQQQLHLPALVTFPFPGDRASVGLAWPALAAFAAALISSRLWRPTPVRRRPR